MADNIATIHMPLYLLQCVSVSLPDLATNHTSPLLHACIKDILCEHSNKLCAWAADNVASLDILFLSVVE